MKGTKQSMWGRYKHRPVDTSRPHAQTAVPQLDRLTQLTVLAEHIGWNWNAVLTGISFKIRGSLWEAVIKAEMASGPKYSKFTNESLYQLIETVHWYASKGYITWNRDKHPVRVAKR